MRLRLLPLLCAALLAMMASSPAASVQAPTMEGYPALGEPAIITVVTPGAEPRRTLRYAVPPSHRASARITMGMAMNARGRGERPPAPIPPMLIDIALGVTAVDPDGSISYDLTFTSFDVEDTGADASAVAAMRTVLSGLAGLTGSATVSDRGVTRAFRLNTDRLKDPRMKEAMGQITSSLDDLSIPLPAEAVGAGARWEARQVVLSDGIHVFQKAVFDLESLEGPAVVLRSALEQHAPTQMMSSDGLPSGMKMRLDNLTGSGEGTIAIRLDELVPRSSAEISSSTAITLITNGRSEPMGVDLRLALSVAPTK